MTGSSYAAQSAPQSPKPLVSVVIPSFNRADILPTAVTSALDQVGVPHLEIIVVDDFSSDATAKLVKQLSDRNPCVRYVRHEENLGGAAARNSGIDAARGTYLAFLDSDDTWLPTKLAVQLKAVQEAPHPDNTVCHTQVCAIRSRGQEILPQHPKAPHESIAEYLFVSGGHIQTSSIFLPTALAARTRFDPSLRKHQDYDFCLRLEEQGACFLLVDQPLVKWHHGSRPDRITTTYGLPASEHFLQTRSTNLGARACDAFWAVQIYPRLLASKPLRATATLLQKALLGPLPLSWYGHWLTRAAKRRLSTSNSTALSRVTP